VKKRVKMAILGCFYNENQPKKDFFYLKMFVFLTKTTCFLSKKAKKIPYLEFNLIILTI